MNIPDIMEDRFSQMRHQLNKPIRINLNKMRAILFEYGFIPEKWNPRMKSGEVEIVVFKPEGVPDMKICEVRIRDLGIALLGYEVINVWINQTNGDQMKIAASGKYYPFERLDGGPEISDFVCGNCYGSGEKRWDPSIPRGPVSWQKEPCFFCEGTGEVIPSEIMDQKRGEA